MSTIPEKDTQYEAIELLYNPLVTRLQQALEVVHQFIIERGLIITGGMAIDYALKLRGDKIYEENSAASLIPDWDFYSPNHMVDAYDLADRLLANGFAAEGSNPATYPIDAIRAVHVSTIRVRVAREVVADVTYIAPEIFEKIPFLDVQGLHVVHPHWQLLNVHRGLTFLLENPPREVIFSRMKKDVTRGAKLYNFYPLIQSGVSVDVIMVPWPADMLGILAANKKEITTIVAGGDTPRSLIIDKKHGTVLYGFAAYAAIYSMYKKILPDQLDGLQPADISEKGFTSINRDIEFIFTDPELAPVFKLNNWDEYEAFIDYELPFYESQLQATGDQGAIRYFHLHNTLIGVSQFSLIAPDGTTVSVYVPPANMILVYFLLRYNRRGSDPIFGRYYTSLLTMCKRIGSFVDDTLGKFADVRLGSKAPPKEIQRIDNIILQSPFFAPKKLYGANNVSESDEKQLFEIRAKISKRLHVDLDIPEPPAPARQYVPRLDSAGHSPFDYESSRYFRVRGRLIPKAATMSILFEDKKEDQGDNPVVNSEDDNE